MYKRQIADWAIAYANQTNEDFQLFLSAIDNGEFEVADEDLDSPDSDAAGPEPDVTKSAFDRALGL